MKALSEINYPEIIKKSWNTVWSNRYLWWFGFFVALGSGGGSFNWSGGEEEKISQVNKEMVESFISQNIAWIMLGALAVVFLVVIFYILGVWGRAALIKSFQFIEKKKKCNFKTGFREGKKYFWRIFGSNIILSLIATLVFIALFFPIAMLFYFKLNIAGIIGILIAIIIFIIVAVIVSFVSEYAAIYIVLSDLKIRSALENSYQLFRKNILAGIVMSFIFIAIKSAIFIAMIMVFAILATPVAATYFLASKLFFWTGAAVGTAIFIVASLLIRSVYEAFQQIAWILFFEEIASQEEDPVEEKSEELSGERLPYPEKIS